MEQKSVSDMIFDKFGEALDKDALFNGINEEFISLVKNKKRVKAGLEETLRKTDNENKESRNSQPPGN